MIKVIFILILGVALLGGAGVGSLYLYTNYELLKSGEKPKVEKPPSPVPTSFIRLAPIAVPLLTPEKVEQIVTVITTVEVVSDKLLPMQQRQPMLINAFLTVLYTSLDERSVLNGNIVNIPAIKEKLLKAAEEISGPGVIKGIHIQAVTQRSF